MTNYKKARKDKTIERNNKVFTFERTTICKKKIEQNRGEQKKKERYYSQ